MIHEFIHIVEQAYINQSKGIANVLVTVVDLNGSSYRKPGVRMLIDADGNKVGAVSGGCVENEILSRSVSVFKTGVPKIITYDGRYRLGCEGILYVLLEPFYIDEIFLKRFQQSIQEREQITIQSFFYNEDDSEGNYGSLLTFSDGKQYSFSERLNVDDLVGHNVFSQTLEPRFNLLIIGGEHDAVKLCAMASLLGWEINVVTSLNDPKTREDFPGATSVTSASPEIFDFDRLNEETAVVLMTHNYSYDLKYLIKLATAKYCYLGIIGSFKRKVQLENEVFSFVPDVSDDFINSIYSPAGLNIGAVTPEEIALSIVSEIMSVVRGKEPYSLRNMKSKIHS